MPAADADHGAIVVDNDIGTSTIGANQISATHIPKISFAVTNCDHELLTSLLSEKFADVL